MSASNSDIQRLKSQLLAGEIDVETFKAELSALETDTEKDELWAEWAAQGLFDSPLEQDGYTSRAGKGFRQVETDG